jgi:hypothetical protein
MMQAPSAVEDLDSSLQELTHYLETNNTSANEVYQQKVKSVLPLLVNRTLNENGILIRFFDV